MEIMFKLSEGENSVTPMKIASALIDYVETSILRNLWNYLEQ